MHNQRQILKLDSRDNVAVALTDLKSGDTVEWDGSTYTLITNVPAKHKFATVDLASGADVLMYGGLVGKTTAPIRKGELLSVRNIHHEASDFHEKSKSYEWTPPDVRRWKERTFLGYHRADGQVGTRNYWLVVPLVFCENRNIGVLQQAFEEELGFATPQVYRREVAELARLYREGKVEQIKNYAQPSNGHGVQSAKLFDHLDGIKFLVHEGGCGGTRQDSKSLCGLIAGYIHHPNVAGATILSLGCQNAQIGDLREQLKLRDPNFAKPVLVFDHQQSGSEFSLLSQAIHQTFLGLIEANSARRAPAALSRLCIGLKCGGSDGFSGISANPAIGHTSDLVTALGGRTILSEFPELCGVEQGLIDRAATKEIGDRFINLMRDYANRARAVGAGFDSNPSPGNIRDGLLTDAMKSAGAAKKGGTSPVTAVLDYPEYSTEPGLNVQRTPGNDVECVTAQVGAGASVVLFTTGLGTPTGNPIAPVVKISTNTKLANHMRDSIDIDTGKIVSGETTIEQMGESILEYVVQVASGELRTAAEKKNQQDFIPWKRDVSL
jgi:altronate hydrolase